MIYLTFMFALYIFVKCSNFSQTYLNNILSRTIVCLSILFIV